MTKAIPYVPAASSHTSEIHVFHYATHSLVWTLHLAGEPSCLPRIAHLHDRSGHTMHVFCSPYLTRAHAEAAVATAEADHEEFAEEFGPVQVFRHRDDPAIPDAAADLVP
jgi:hypothetical protein